MSERFKGDEVEENFYQSARQIFQNRYFQTAQLFIGGYEAYPLGDLLYDNNLVPLSRAIKRDIFRESFSSLFDLFLEAGSFEGYFKIFTDIFGDGVDVQFTVPEPGRLQIDIVADSVVFNQFISREVDDNTFVESDMIAQNNDKLVFQNIKGFESEFEVEQMLFEMVPNGIFTEITLTLS